MSNVEPCPLFTDPFLDLIPSSSISFDLTFFQFGTDFANIFSRMHV